MKLKVYKLNENATVPSFATEGSACFDLCACLCEGSDEVLVYHNVDSEMIRTTNGKFIVEPRKRVMIPTGLIFDIPKGYSVRLHPRSGLALKSGINLVNQEAVIDSDYVNEVKILLTNLTSTPFVVEHGMRICQGELVKSTVTDIVEVKKAPKSSTRDGGFGSTGV